MDWSTFRRNLETLIAAVGSPELVDTSSEIPYFTIYNWRKRDQAPSLANIRQLAKTYEVSVDDLLGRVLRASDFKFIPGPVTRT